MKRNYQEIAADFNLTRKKEVWPEIKKLAEKVSAGSRVLDVGCGNGRLLEVLPDNKIEYLGLDNSAELVKIASQNYPTQKFLVADILKLESVKEISSGTYDYVFCLAVLQHIPSRELRIEALRQLAVPLNTSGRLILSSWNLWVSPKHRPLLFKNYGLKIIGRNKLGFNDLLFPWKNAQGEATSERYYHAFTKKELKKLGRLAGLKLISLKRDHYNFWAIWTK